MSGLEYIQTGLAFIGAAGMGGTWYRLGAVLGGFDNLKQRVERLENQLLFGKG